MLLKKIILIMVTLGLLGLSLFYFYPEVPLTVNAPISLLVVNKSKHQLLAFSNGSLVKTYHVSLGKVPIGKKEFKGDNKTPEGMYFINDKNPQSGFYKNLGISYPNPTDSINALKIGKPSGSNIKIHGLRNGIGFIGNFHRLFDWTAGCIAVTNNEIEELYDAVQIGTPIEIKP